MIDQKSWRVNLSVIVPAYNEAEGVRTVLESLCSFLPEAEIIVVDDGSSDGTGDVVKSFGRNVVLLTHAFNLGYGASLKTGMRESSRDYVAWFDADNEHRVEDLLEMGQKAVEKNLAAVIAVRKKTNSVSLRSLGKMLIRFLCRILNTDIGHDVNCGLRVFRKEVIARYYSLLPDRYSASMVSTLLMIERRYPYELFTVETNERIGSSKVVLKDGYDALILSMGMILLFAPMKIFLSLGLLFLLVGVVYSLYILITVSSGIPAAGGITVIAGMLSVGLGLLADQIRQIRLNQLPEIAFYRRHVAHDNDVSAKMKGSR